MPLPPVTAAEIDALAEFIEKVGGLTRAQYVFQSGIERCGSWTMKKAKGLLFSYPGSKWRLGKRFERYYPPHRVYIDMFGGSAALIRRQEPRVTEVYNDVDSDVFNVFAIVKDRTCEEVPPG